jgi:tRNA pseudouridine55 synthase
MQGILLVDKPAGWTSFDVVNYVRKIVAVHEGKKPKNTKVGHTGTLDPFATGLLVLLVGKDYTRKATELSKVDKTYEVTMRFGQVSTTGDPEGELTDVNSIQPNQDELQAVLQKFTGQIQQIPPAYSAIKVDGQRAYKLARAGKEVAIEPRTITVHGINLIDYLYPEVTITATVSSGTYIRTLVEDIASALGTGAYTSRLRRTRVGEFEIGGAVQAQNLTAQQIQQQLLP